jgi:hypothetical protein
MRRSAPKRRIKDRLETSIVIKKPCFLSGNKAKNIKKEKSESKK